MVQLAGLVVEYLIIGLVSSIWIVLALLSLGKINFQLDPSILVFTPLLYILGMISDYLGSSILSRKKATMENKIFNERGINKSTFSTHQALVQMAVHCPELLKALEMRASRYRIARGTLVNIPFIGLATIWLYYVSSLPFLIILIIVVTIIIILLCVVVFKMWERYLEYFIRQEVYAVEVLKELLKKKKIKYLED